MDTITNNLSGLKAADFQKIVAGKEVNLYILRNASGNEVGITNYGGAIVSIMVPDRDGNIANVIQGHDNIDSVINSPEPFLSTLIGRYGNRIAKGIFHLNGKEYRLAVNNGPNHLHGGPTGFHARVWDAEQI
ncbi:MAG: galactose-1-epimerase, partial [Bacteroidaceae bacterium]|nr:galactose-1-epimerase [Bacteroidaceae bacterium]